MQSESVPAKPETREEALIKLLQSSRSMLWSLVPLLFPSNASKVLNHIDKINVALSTTPK